MQQRRVVIGKRLNRFRTLEQEASSAALERDRELVDLASRFTHVQIAFELGVVPQTVDKRVKAARGRLASVDGEFVATTDQAKARDRRRRQQQEGRKLVALNTGESVEDQLLARRLARGTLSANSEPASTATEFEDEDEDSIRQTLRDAELL